MKCQVSLAELQRIVGEQQRWRSFILPKVNVFRYWHSFERNQIGLRVCWDRSQGR